MKSMQLTGIRQMGMMEVETPGVIHFTDVLIRMKTIGVCGSDIHYYISGKIGSQVGGIGGGADIDITQILLGRGGIGKGEVTV